MPDKLGPKEVIVVIETHKVYCEGEILTPYVESVEAGSQVTEREIHQTIRDAMDDWYRRREHEQKEDQAGDSEGAKEGEPEGGPAAADPAASVDPGGSEAS